MSNDPDVRMLFWFPPDFRIKLKVAAAMKGTTMRQYIMDAVLATMAPAQKPKSAPTRPVPGMYRGEKPKFGYDTDE